MIAKIVGIVAIIKGIAFVLKSKEMHKMMKDLVSNRAIIFIIAAVELIIGLFIVINHNIWVNSWVVIVTILGWLMIIEGTSFLLLSKNMVTKFVEVFDKERIYLAGGVLAIVAGALLTYVSFSAGV